jgi:hypothetical protein
MSEIAIEETNGAVYLYSESGGKLFKRSASRHLSFKQFLSSVFLPGSECVFFFFLAIRILL